MMSKLFSMSILTHLSENGLNFFVRSYQRLQSKAFFPFRW